MRTSQKSYFRLFNFDYSRTRSLPLCPLVFSLIWKVVIISGFKRTAYSEQKKFFPLFAFCFFLFKWSESKHQAIVKAKSLSEEGKNNALCICSILVCFCRCCCCFAMPSPYSFRSLLQHNVWGFLQINSFSISSNSTPIKSFFSL